MLRMRTTWPSRHCMATETPDTRPEADIRIAQPRTFVPVLLLAYLASAVALLAAGGVSIPLRLDTRNSYVHGSMSADS